MSHIGTGRELLSWTNLINDVDHILVSSCHFAVNSQGQRVDKDGITVSPFRGVVFKLSVSKIYHISLQVEHSTNSLFTQGNENRQKKLPSQVSGNHPLKLFYSLRICPAPVILGSQVLTFTIFAALMVYPSIPIHPNQ